MTADHELLELSDPELRACVAKLRPRAREVLYEATRRAHFMHAEEVEIEHLLASMMFDETTGGARMVLHAFADPETIGVELSALCPGISVVGSGQSRPFSVHGVEALRRARELGQREGSHVEPEQVLAGACSVLDEELLELLSGAGLDAARLAIDPPVAPADTLGESLFRSFSNLARRALGRACRLAVALERDAISPGHLVLGVLESETELAREVGLSPTRARMLLDGRDADPTRPAARRLAPGAELIRLLNGVDEGADTQAILGWVLQHGTEELRLLFLQQKVTPELLNATAGRFPDPE